MSYLLHRLPRKKTKRRGREKTFRKKHSKRKQKKKVGPKNEGEGGACEDGDTGRKKENKKKKNKKTTESTAVSSRVLPVTPQRDGLPPGGRGAAASFSVTVCPQYSKPGKETPRSPGHRSSSRGRRLSCREKEEEEKEVEEEEEGERQLGTGGAEKKREKKGLGESEGFARLSSRRGKWTSASSDFSHGERDRKSAIKRRNVREGTRRQNLEEP